MAAHYTRARHGAARASRPAQLHEAWIGEHHSGGFEIIACPEMFIAAAAERTRHIRLGTGVVSLPYHNPFTVAGAHDAARLHDARPRHVRRRARLARLRRDKMGLKAADQRRKHRRVARRHHGADAGPHGHARRPTGSTCARRGCSSRATRSPMMEMAVASLALADRRGGGRQARHRHAVDRRHLGRALKAHASNWGVYEEAARKPTARRADRSQVAHRHLRPCGGDARAGARGRANSASTTSRAISPRSPPSPSSRPTSRRPGRVPDRVRSRLHRHAGRLHPPFRAAVEGLERRLRRRPAAGAQLGGLAGDASAAASGQVRAKPHGEQQMSKSILMHENGGPEKMQLEDVEVGSPGPGQVKITPHRDRPQLHRRLYPLGPLPDAAAQRGRPRGAPA